MAVYVYRKASSTGARELSVALGGKRFRGRIRPITEVVRAGDVVICWGEALPEIPGVKILNGGPIQNKFKDAIKLKAAGIPTIEAAQSKPAPAPAYDETAIRGAWEDAVESAEDFVEIPFNRSNPVFIQGIRDFHATITRLQQQLATPLPDSSIWLPRVYNHVGGADLLQPPATAEYWVKKEAIQAEVRIHSFNGKSIKAGSKQPREGVQQHPWVRSYDGGWRIVYDNFESTEAQRKLAHKAVKTLGLNFGAVDLGQKADGTWIVLEVNRAPGLADGSVATYAAAIQAWMQAA
jgi:hypothetical protein